MTKQEKEQLEALEMYFWREGQKANEKMMKATSLLNQGYYQGRSSAFVECEYLLKDVLELGRLELPAAKLEDKWASVVGVSRGRQDAPSDARRSPESDDPGPTG